MSHPNNMRAVLQTAKLDDDGGRIRDNSGKTRELYKASRRGAPKMVRIQCAEKGGDGAVVGRIELQLLRAHLIWFTQKSK
jgi:hypothetical protein